MTASRQIRKEFLKSKEKEVINLQKRLNVLYRAKRNLGYVKLDPPIRKGWERTYALRHDLKSHRDYKTLLTVLSRIQSPLVADNKDFILPKRRHRRAKPLEQTPNCLSDKDYYALEANEQRYFAPVWKKYRYWNTLYRVWEFTKPQFLVFSVKPYYIKEVRLFDQDIEIEIKEINDRLWGKENLYQRYAKDKPSSCRDYGPKVKEKILDREMFKEVEEAL